MELAAIESDEELKDIVAVAREEVSAWNAWVGGYGTGSQRWWPFGALINSTYFGDTRNSINFKSCVILEYSRHYPPRLSKLECDGKYYFICSKRTHE